MCRCHIRGGTGVFPNEIDNDDHELVILSRSGNNRNSIMNNTVKWISPYLSRWAISPTPTWAAQGLGLKHFPNIPYAYMENLIIIMYIRVISPYLHDRSLWYKFFSAMNKGQF